MIRNPNCIILKLLQVQQTVLLYL